MKQEDRLQWFLGLFKRSKKSRIEKLLVKLKRAQGPVTEEMKSEVINGLVELVGSEFLQAFYLFDLKNHIESTLYNEATDEYFRLTFTKIDTREEAGAVFKNRREMKMIRHMCLNVQGALRNRKHINYMQDETGRFLSNKEARDYLKQCLAEGKRVIPVGDCEGFDFQTGCPGHPIIEDKTIK